jgi:flagellar biosynthesis/type III secretory pathway M-ring protein FliF/YscJ
LEEEMEKEIAEENEIFKAIKLHRIEHFIAIFVVFLSLFCICCICIIKKRIKKREYDEDEDNSIGKHYFYNKKNAASSPYDYNGYDSTYS